MTVTFLGTGTSQGVPVIACECEVCKSVDYRDKRTRTSIHIQDNDVSVVVDTGPDFRIQMLRERIKRLDAVIFTHEHKDHTAGLDDIRSFNFVQKSDIPVYGRKRVLTQLKQEFSYIFSENKYPGVPQITLNEIENKPFQLKGVPVTPIEVLHYKLSVFGYRFYDFTYITDANYISETEMKKLEGTKVLVINALQKTEHISHFTLDQAIKLAQDVEAEQTYLTHISHKMGKHGHVEKELPENVSLAFDGLKIVM